jgi:poly(ADP-ribose) glycohydrolase ARH3
VDQFALYLQEKMGTIEKNEEQPSMLNSFLHNSSQPRRTTINMTKSSYVRKLQEMRHLLKNPTVSAEKVVDVLGHFVSAYGSVCTAIYSFLRSAKDDSASAGGSSESPVQRAIRYAISLGGDTDTIANMTGALAGAYYGHEAVPPVLLSHCEAEGVEQAIELADCLYQAVEK